MWTVAAANKRFEGPLGNYNGLSDQHLAHYFSNPMLKAHLIKAGLVTKDGIIVPETDVKLMNIEKEKQNSYCELLATAIVQKALHLEYSCQAKIQQNLERLSKAKLVERIKNVCKKTSKVSSDISVNSVKCCLKCHSSECFCSKPEETGKDAIFSGVNSYPNICHDFLYDSNKFKGCRSKRPYSVDILTSWKTLSRKESPYLYSMFTRGSKKPFLSSKRLSRSASSNFRKLKSKISRKVFPNLSQNSEIDLESNLKNSESSVSLPLPNEDKKQEYEDKCKITLYYHGDKPFCMIDAMKNEMQDIVINQQHCGGNPIVVFKGRKTLKDTLNFMSHRHPGYPFSITVFIDGVRSLKLSACCEYRYLKGSRLGGKNGYFSIVAVEGGHPCTKCLVQESKWKCTSLSLRRDVTSGSLNKVNIGHRNGEKGNNGKICCDFKTEYLDLYRSHEDHNSTVQIRSSDYFDCKEVKVFEEASADFTGVHSMLDCFNSEKVKSDSEQLTEEIIDEACSEVDAGPEQCVDLECYTDSESDYCTSRINSPLRSEKGSASLDINSTDNHHAVNARDLSNDGGQEYVVFAEVHVTPTSPS